MIYEIEEAREEEIHSRIWWNVTTWNDKTFLVASNNRSRVAEGVKTAGYRPLLVYPTTASNALYAVNHGEKIYEVEEE